MTIVDSNDAIDRVYEKARSLSSKLYLLHPLATGANFECFDQLELSGANDKYLSLRVASIDTSTAPVIRSAQVQIAIFHTRQVKSLSV